MLENLPCTMKTAPAGRTRTSLVAHRRNGAGKLDFPATTRFFWQRPSDALDEHRHRLRLAQGRAATPSASSSRRTCAAIMDRCTVFSAQGRWFQRAVLLRTRSRSQGQVGIPVLRFHCSGPSMRSARSSTSRRTFAELIGAMGGRMAASPRPTDQGDFVRRRGHP